MHIFFIRFVSSDKTSYFTLLHVLLMYFKINRIVKQFKLFRTNVLRYKSIFTHFRLFLTKFWLNSLRSQRRRTFSCAKSEYSPNFTLNTLSLQFWDGFYAENVNFQAFWSIFDPRMAPNIVKSTSIHIFMPKFGFLVKF